MLGLGVQRSIRGGLCPQRAHSLVMMMESKQIVNVSWIKRTERRKYRSKRRRGHLELVGVQGSGMDHGGRGSSDLKLKEQDGEARSGSGEIAFEAERAA